MSKVTLIEVGLRDGLQNESKKLTNVQKYNLVKKIEQANIKNIEVGAFVSPKWVPQMKGSAELIKKLYKYKKNNVVYSALVPNERGMLSSLDTPIKKVAIFAASSEGFSQKNINCSISESFKRFKTVMNLATKNKIKVRGYLSTAFGCPYDGVVSHSKVISLTKKLLALGVYEVAISDTIGVATPNNVEALLQKVKKAKIDMSKIALHMHNTKGVALANVYEGYRQGVRVFDTSVGGLGGCPYAKGASGNLATEDLVYMFNGMKVKTGIDLQSLIKTKNWIEKSCKIKTRSHH